MKKKFEQRERESLRDQLLQMAIYRALNRAFNETVNSSESMTGVIKPYDVFIRLETELKNKGLHLSLGKGVFNFWTTSDKKTLHRNRLHDRVQRQRTELFGKTICFKKDGI